MRSPALALSHRRAFLATIGAAWAGYGVGILLDPRYGTARGLAHITRHVPLDALGWMWVSCGLVALAAALLGAGGRVQAAGFSALAAPATLWGTAFTITWATGDYPSAVGSVCGWLGFALGILWVSGMDDPLPRHLRKKR